LPPDDARRFIKEIIDSEDNRSPLNDQRISDFLKEKGFYLSRKMVCDYRNQLKIPDSRKRRGK